MVRVLVPEEVVGAGEEERRFKKEEEEVLQVLDEKKISSFQMTRNKRIKPWLKLITFSVRFQLSFPFVFPSKVFCACWVCTITKNYQDFGVFVTDRHLPEKHFAFLWCCVCAMTRSLVRIPRFL